MSAETKEIKQELFRAAIDHAAFRLDSKIVPIDLSLIKRMRKLPPDQHRKRARYSYTLTATDYAHQTKLGLLKYFPNQLMESALNNDSRDNLVGAILMTYEPDRVSRFNGVMLMRLNGDTAEVLCFFCLSSARVHISDILFDYLRLKLSTEFPQIRRIVNPMNPKFVTKHRSTHNDFVPIISKAVKQLRLPYKDGWGLEIGVNYATLDAQQKLRSRVSIGDGGRSRI